MILKSRWIFAPIVTLCLLGCGEKNAVIDSKSMTVFCGSASKPVMEVIARDFERDTGVKVNLIFGGSGTLLSQIELSKKGEIYLPGSPDYIEIARRKKLIFEDSPKIVAYLVPAIITPAGNPGKISSLNDLARPGVRVGIGNPETVCLGLYGVELLETNGLLEQVLANTVTFGGSCSKTANLAAMNKLDAILGWRVFHYWNPDKMELVQLRKEEIPRISYIPISIPVHTKDRALSETFVDYVLSTRGRSVYEKFGYLTSEEKARQFAPNAGVGGEYRLSPKYFELIKRIWKDR